MRIVCAIAEITTCLLPNSLTYQKREGGKEGKAMGSFCSLLSGQSLMLKQTFNIVLILCGLDHRERKAIYDEWVGMGGRP
jgi:hypothetical protein